MPWDTHHSSVVKRQGTRGEKLSGFNPVPWDGFALLWEFPRVRAISPTELDGKPLLIPDVNKMERSVVNDKKREEKRGL